MLLSHVAIVYRIGGALSFTSGTSLPTRRSTRADMLHYRNISQMGGHCYDTRDYDHQNNAIGPSGVPPVVTINNSTFTAPRLSGTDSLPLMSRMTINPVSRSLNGTVVNCFEGTSSTESVATSTIYIIGGEN